MLALRRSPKEERSMSTSLHSEIMIDASARRVWAILTDFEAYPTWNPFIRRIAGQPM